MYTFHDPTQAHLSSDVLHTLIYFLMSQSSLSPRTPKIFFLMNDFAYCILSSWNALIYFSLVPQYNWEVLTNILRQTSELVISESSQGTLFSEAYKPIIYTL